MPSPRRSLLPNPFHGLLAGEGFIPPGLYAHITAQHKKAGANISFAPAVLLLRSHSLITLFVIFRTASASSWESSYLYANFDCPFKTLTNCSLDLPSGSLFAQKHLWNVVKSVRLLRSFLGYRGLMLRTAPLNSSTLECLLVDQMKFRFFLFGGVVTVIATDLLSS